jgi:nicotinamidase-related amidase
MPLVARDDSLLTVIDLQPRFWAERLDAEDKRCAEEAARRAAWLAAAAHALGVPAVITEEDPEINGPTDEAVLAPLRASAPVFTKTVFRAGQLPRDHGGGLVNGTSDRVAGKPALDRKCA